MKCERTVCLLCEENSIKFSLIVDSDVLRCCNNRIRRHCTTIVTVHIQLTIFSSPPNSVYTIIKIGGFRYKACCFGILLDYQHPIYSRKFQAFVSETRFRRSIVEEPTQFRFLTILPESFFPSLLLKIRTAVSQTFTRKTVTRSNLPRIRRELRWLSHLHCIGAQNDRVDTSERFSAGTQRHT